MFAINLLHAAILGSDLNGYILFYHSDTERAGKVTLHSASLIISAVITH